MDEGQLREYVELQRALINVMLKRANGHAMEELRAIMAIEEFERRLPCNADEEEIYQSLISRKEKA